MEIEIFLMAVTEMMTEAMEGLGAPSVERVYLVKYTAVV